MQSSHIFFSNSWNFLICALSRNLDGISYQSSPKSSVIYTCFILSRIVSLVTTLSKYNNKIKNLNSNLLMCCCWAWAACSSRLNNFCGGGIIRANAGGCGVKDISGNSSSLWSGTSLWLVVDEVERNAVTESEVIEK